MRVSLLTLGCKVNQAESSRIAVDLVTSGCSIVDLDGNPDFCIINTCSVTSRSDHQSRQLIRRAARVGSKVIVTGCYSELNEDAVKSMDGVTTVVPNHNKEHIINMLGDMTSCKRLSLGQNARSRPFVKVQDGCNNRCTYCIIPRTRGQSRSRDMTEVIKEINSLEKSYNEIVITGIHLGTYGYDLTPKVSLSYLLRDILLKTNVRRIRLSSLEVNEIDDELVELIQEERVCKHLHIPLQSGDDRILGLMGRNYNISQFKDIYSSICQKVPGVSIGTDIIVGFPGEGANEFENTKQFLEDSYISYVHVFPFSPRKGTKAFEMKPRVNDNTMKKRCEIIRSLGKRKKDEYLHNQLGKVLDLVVEEIDEDGYGAGTTANYLRVRACLKGYRLTDVAYVRIAGVKDDTLIGYLIEPS